MSELGIALLEALAAEAAAERRLELVAPFDEQLARAEYEVDNPEHVGGTWEMLPARTRGRRIRRMRTILDAVEAQSAAPAPVAPVARARP